jgi:hypothetical protein
MPATYIVRVIDVLDDDAVVETIEFDSRAALAIFFENGASFNPAYRYLVSRTV